MDTLHAPNLLRKISRIIGISLLLFTFILKGYAQTDRNKNNWEPIVDSTTDFPALDQEDNKLVLVILYDQSGNESYSKVKIISTEGTSVIAMDTEERLHPGVYSIRGTSDNSIYNRKLTIL